MTTQLLAFPKPKAVPMYDIVIITNSRFETAAINAESQRAVDWLQKHLVMVADNTVTVSLDGAVEIERDARAAGLTVETR